MTFKDSVRQALYDALHRDPSVILIGVGITTEGAMWGTLEGLYNAFGPNRVIEGPLSEAALTGMCVGLATQGFRPVLMHHRIDFSLLGLDQLVNHAAKLRTMFGGKQTCPMVIRAVVGRGWGNGPQHTQSLHGLYAHIPGIKVVVPSHAHDAYDLMTAAIADPDPVVYIEHRWLHNDEERPCVVTSDIGRADIVRMGRAATIVAVGPMVNDALAAADALWARHQLLCEVIDLRSINPIDWTLVLASVNKTHRLIVCDPDWGHGGIAAEIIATAAECGSEWLLANPTRVTWPDRYVPSAAHLEADYYPGAAEIQAAVLRMFHKDEHVNNLVPNERKAVAGPF